MRKILGRLGSDERHTFQAEFGKYGYKRYYDKSRGDLYSPTMVVRNVRIVDDPENPKMVTDHLWLNLTKGFANLGLLETGDLIQFNGRVSQYNKGFINKDKVDYELTYPSKVQLLVDKKTQPLPEDHRAQIGMIMNLNYKFYLNNQRPLVAYFMDGFAQWQKAQDAPLPIECHKAARVALLGVSAEELKNVVIAYEPIWAIGTGRTATAEQAAEVCTAIRAIIRNLYGARVARSVTIQYGGSMNPKNAAELLAQPDVDGGLIGGASLKPDQFVDIINAANQE